MGEASADIDPEGLFGVEEPPGKVGGSSDGIVEGFPEGAGGPPVVDSFGGVAVVDFREM